MRKIKLPKYEWDFASLPMSEYEPAWQHEIYREVLRYLRNLGKLESWDKNILKGCIANLPDDAYDEHYRHSVIKEVAWTSLKVKHKKALIEHYKYGADVFAPGDRPWVCDELPLDIPLVCLSKSPYQLTKTDFSSVLKRLNFTAVDKRSSLCLFEIRHIQKLDNQKDLVDLFAKWLKEFRPSLRTAPPRKRPESYLTKLMDLAVYRLVEHTKKTNTPKSEIATLIKDTYPKQRGRFDSTKVSRSRLKASKLIKKEARKKNKPLENEIKTWKPDSFSPMDLVNLIANPSIK